MKIRILLCLVLFAMSISSSAQDFGLLYQAQQAYDKKDWDGAKSLYSQVVSANPYNGKYAYRLADALYESKDFYLAAHQYTKAFDLGYNKALSSYNAACSFALASRSEDAIQWLRKSLVHGLQDHEQVIRRDQDLASIKGLEAFKEFMPDPIKGGNRVESWQKDILYLKRKFELMHHGLFEHISKEIWNDELGRLIEQIDDLEDSRIIVELMRIVSSIGAGHSYVIPPFNGDKRFNQLPIEFYAFSDGIYIRKASQKYKRLIGMKLEAINDHSIEEVLKEVSKVANPENDIINDWSALFYATLTEVLHAYDIVDDISYANLTLSLNGDREVYRVETQPFSLDVITSLSKPTGWTSLQASSTAPLYRSNLQLPFWSAQCEGFLYAQLNQIGNDADRSLKDFGRDLVDKLNESGDKVLVLDIRLNNGGNGMLNRDFLLELMKWEGTHQRGRFFVITGRKTFSAAMLLATKLDEYTEAIFIGEPTGGKPNHVGDTNNFILPNSGLIASASMTYWQSAVSYDGRSWIEPEVYLPISSNDFKLGKDPVIEWVKGILKAQK